MEGNPLSFIIPKAIVEAIIDHARREAPNECCGILAGRDGRVFKHFLAKNADASRYRYHFDPREYLQIWQEIEANGWELQAIYHSHTFTGAYPSATDIDEANPILPEALYIIVSLADPEEPVVRAFRIREGRVLPEELRVSE